MRRKMSIHGVYFSAALCLLFTCGGAGTRNSTCVEKRKVFSKLGLEFCVDLIDRAGKIVKNNDPHFVIPETEVTFKGTAAPDTQDSLIHVSRVHMGLPGGYSGCTNSRQNMYYRK